MMPPPGGTEQAWDENLHKPELRKDTLSGGKAAITAPRGYIQLPVRRGLPGSAPLPHPEQARGNPGFGHFWKVFLFLNAKNGGTVLFSQGWVPSDLDPAHCLQSIADHAVIPDKNRQEKHQGGTIPQCFSSKPTENSGGLS